MQYLFHYAYVIYNNDIINSYNWMHRRFYRILFAAKQSFYVQYAVHVQKSKEAQHSAVDPWSLFGDSFNCSYPFIDVCTAYKSSYISI